MAGRFPVRVWIDGGQAVRKGTWLTTVLWLVSLGAHLGYDYLVVGKGPSPASAPPA